jgi:hypothetical protein
VKNKLGVNRSDGAKDNDEPTVGDMENVREA